MILTDLKIHHVRNISNTHLSLHPRFNVITGPNGSGKTSVLEALYLLSCGRSFRSREITPIISHDQKKLTVFARGLNQETVSIQKSSSELTQIKLNNQFCKSTSQLAYALPCQIFYSDLFQIIDAGSSVRRSLLDWGLFHVEQHYLSVWKDYKRILKQRNALLRNHAPYAQFIPWDKQLNIIANELDNFRQEYFLGWEATFNTVLRTLTDVPCTIKYYKGWDKKNVGRSLEETLLESFKTDNQKLYTQYGAHQADIIIEINTNKAKQVLSRGQQKIILFSLKLAQADLLQKECLYLIDDLTAELDESHQGKLLNLLAQRKGQYVITNTSCNNTFNSFFDEQGSAFTIDKGILTVAKIGSLL